MGSKEIEEGASHLVELKRLIQELNKKEKQVPLREPDLMIVVTGGKMAYTRPDGVKIIPLACLKDWTWNSKCFAPAYREKQN